MMDRPQRTRPYFIFLLALSFSLLFIPMDALQASELADKKVLVVMSYHHGNTWQDQQREGIEKILSDADLRYFYLDTKRDKIGGPGKAKEAFALYQKFKPDAVITADDHAQSMFVVPYLREKVDTPVVFLGVNDDATRYGFPAANVTGVIEVKHVKESIVFAQLLLPNLKKIGVLYTDNDSNRLNVAAMQKEQQEYPANIVAYFPLTFFEEARKIVSQTDEAVDAYFSFNLTGMLDQQGKAMEATTCIKQLAMLSTKPIIAADSYDIESGALCGVIKTGQEQGELAAQMVRKILDGTPPVNEIPLAKNTNGVRYINIQTARRFDIPLSIHVIAGSKLVK